MIDPGVIGVFIPIIAVGGVFAWMIALSPLGKALAERLLHGPRPAGGGPEHAEFLQKTGVALMTLASRRPKSEK